MNKKEQQQLFILGGIVIVFIGVMLYMYRDKFLPVAGGPVYAPVSRAALPSSNRLDALLERPDFKELKSFGDVPVRSGKTGSEDPFAPFQE